jgi:hypothetical protein
MAWKPARPVFHIFQGRPGEGSFPRNSQPVLIFVNAGHSSDGVVVILQPACG